MFNDLACEIVSKSLEENIGNIKLCESEIDIKTNKLVPFQRNVNNVANKDWIILDVLKKNLNLNSLFKLNWTYFTLVSISSEFH